MDFLKKAKAGLKDIEADLTKATSSLGLGSKEGQAGSSDKAAPQAGPSQAETPASTTINTPATTTTSTPAPSVNEAPKVKLPLAIRKNVRDKWEAKLPEFEEQISKLMETPWKISVDPGQFWSYGTDGFVKENPGGALCAYIEPAIRHLDEYYLEKVGDDGRKELNTLASAHAITIEETSRSDISYCGCEVSGGYLRILFAKGYAGTNVNDAFDNLADAVNEAGKAAYATGGAIPLDFNARMSIRKDYTPKIDELTQRFREMLKMDTLTLNPHLEGNFAATQGFINSLTKKNRGDDLPRGWQKRFGLSTYEYFENLYRALENKKFDEDDMLQEGFADAVDKSVIGLRVVDKLEKGTYNESVLENGTLWIQTIPKYWTTNMSDTGDKVMDLL